MSSTTAQAPQEPSAGGASSSAPARASDEQIAADYELLTSAAGLLDRSERGRLALTGSGAAEFLGGQATNDIEALRPGTGCYAAFLTHKGKMLGDLRVLAIGDSSEEKPTELLLETERPALQALFDMIRHFKIGYDVELHKRTLETSLLSLIGPQAQAVAAKASDGSPLQGEESHLQGEEHSHLQGEEHSHVQGEEHSHLQGEEHSHLQGEEHSHLQTSVAGRQVRLVLTAEPQGIDVLCDSGDRDAVEAALIAAGARPAGAPAAEIVRVEHGRPRYGIDLDETVIPQEAGLNERAVSFTKGCYVGQETVARLYYKGKPNRHLRGLRLAEPVAAGAQLLMQDRVVGTLTSSVLSPKLGPIGLALVRREAELGATLLAGPDALAATLVELPFAH